MSGHPKEQMRQQIYISTTSVVNVQSIQFSNVPVYYNLTVIAIKQ